MIAENVYSIFKALSPSESERFIRMLDKEAKKIKKASHKTIEEQELKQYCDTIVHNYLVKLKAKCLKEMEQYTSKKNP